MNQFLLLNRVVFLVLSALAFYYYFYNFLLRN